MSGQQGQGGNVAAQIEHGRETMGATRRRPTDTTVVSGAPHTRPGDQNALCIETDQA